MKENRLFLNSKEQTEEEDFSRFMKTPTELFRRAIFSQVSRTVLNNPELEDEFTDSYLLP